MNWNVHRSELGRLILTEDKGIPLAEPPIFEGSRQQCLNWIHEMERRERRLAAIATGFIYTGGGLAVLFAIFYWNLI